MIGARVSVTTSLGVTEGTLFTVDAGCVVLEQFLSSSSADSKANYTVFNADAISEFKVLAEAPSVGDGQKRAALPAVDADFVRSRAERAITKAAEDALRINPKVTARQQAIFDALSKTMPSEWHDDANNGSCIFLLKSVFIRPPFAPEDCVAKEGESTLLGRVQKMLAAIHKRLDADPRFRAA